MVAKELGKLVGMDEELLKVGEMVLVLLNTKVGFVEGVVDCFVGDVEGLT